jgi:hypothetical protein
MNIERLSTFLTITIFILLILFNLIESQDIYAQVKIKDKAAEKIDQLSKTADEIILSEESIKVKEANELEALASKEVNNGLDVLTSGQKPDLVRVWEKIESFVNKPFYTLDFRNDLSNIVDRYLHDYIDLSNSLMTKIITGLLLYI